MIIVVMGVCGSGKTSVGSELARRLGIAFLEGDEFHPAVNIAKMSQGIALDDSDREPWLNTIAAALAELEQQQKGAVLACSALKRCYRDILRSGCEQTLQFVHLTGAKALITEHMTVRQDHYMPLSLLESQLATLEIPQADEQCLNLTVDKPVDELVTLVLDSLAMNR